MLREAFDPLREERDLEFREPVPGVGREYSATMPSVVSAQGPLPILVVLPFRGFTAERADALSGRAEALECAPRSCGARRAFRNVIARGFSARCATDGGACETLSTAGRWPQHRFSRSGTSDAKGSRLGTALPDARARGCPPGAFTRGREARSRVWRLFAMGSVRRPQLAAPSTNTAGVYHRLGAEATGSWRTTFHDNSTREFAWLEEKLHDDERAVPGWATREGRRYWVRPICRGAWRS